MSEAANFPDPPTVNSSFTTQTDYDLNGASDGTYIVQWVNGNVHVFNMTGGDVIPPISSNSFWCGGSNPLPVCSGAGFPGDVRVIYDTGSQRWGITALWTFGPAPATDVIAVSTTSNPTQGWYRWQFPACGASAGAGSDQPHTGFNSQWIVVTSACNTMESDDHGLAVFDKSNLYAGGSQSMR